MHTSCCVVPIASCFGLSRERGGALATLDACLYVRKRVGGVEMGTPIGKFDSKGGEGLLQKLKCCTCEQANSLSMCCRLLAS